MIPSLKEGFHVNEQETPENITLLKFLSFFLEGGDAGGTSLSGNRIQATALRALKPSHYNHQGTPYTALISILLKHLHYRVSSN